MTNIKRLGWNWEGKEEAGPYVNQRTKEKRKAHFFLNMGPFAQSVCRRRRVDLTGGFRQYPERRSHIPRPLFFPRKLLGWGLDYCCKDCERHIEGI